MQLYVGGRQTGGSQRLGLVETSAIVEPEGIVVPLDSDSSTYVHVQVCSQDRRSIRSHTGHSIRAYVLI